MDALRALRGKGPIRKLTAELPSTEVEWRFALRNLRDARLIAEEDPANANTLDCHPLVREHFADSIQAHYPKAWKAGNSRLFDYYRRTSEEFPETIERIQPLFIAVAHGCAAERYQEALDDVWWRRISRGQESFVVTKLNALENGLACLASFFRVRWSSVHRMKRSDQAYVLHETGYYLWQLGRLNEAIDPMHLALEAAVEMKSWENATIRADILSRIRLCSGDIDVAVEVAEQGIELGERTGAKVRQWHSQSTLAGILHQAGRLDKSEKLFGEAEEICGKALNSLAAYNYHQLLLDNGDYQTVLSQASRQLETAESSGFPRDVALHNLSLGEAYLRSADLPNATEHLGRAVECFRESGQEEYMLYGLLAHAKVSLANGDIGLARSSLKDVLARARYTGMRLLEADADLGFVCLNFVLKDYVMVRASLSEAKRIIEETGYHRRDQELAALESQLPASSNGNLS